MRTPLEEISIREALTHLPDWVHEDNALRKEYTFASFREAVSFIVRLSFEAEALDHHPELANVYNRVTVTLRTHDAGNRVTEADLRLAKAIEAFAWV